MACVVAGFLSKLLPLLQLVTVARVQVLVGYSKEKHDKLILFAEVQQGTHTEETSSDKEEAELDSASNLNATGDHA
jgi:hypothetical protein